MKNKIYNENDIINGDAVKCLQCGEIKQRLQWTHFIKCLGDCKTLSDYKSKYPNAENIAKNLRRKTAVTKNNMISKYGEVIGLIRWQEYCTKQSISNTYEYKSKKYGWTKEEFDEFNKNRSITIEKCIERHGEIKGLEMWEHYCFRQKYTNTLEYFIEKYSQIGSIKWLENNKLKGMTNNPAYLAKKYNITYQEAIEKIEKRTTTSPALISLAEKTFVDSFESLLGTEIFFSYKTKQLHMWSHITNSSIFFDIADIKLKKIIEFNGDFWHCNPKKFNIDYFNKVTKLTAKETWEKDQNKIYTANQRGFSVYTVWEDDFKNSPELTLTEAVNWWKS